MEPRFLDNHLLVLDKPWGLLTQPSGTGDDSLEAQGKAWLKEYFNKPGAVFLEAVHRIDRPVGGVVLFARTSKALSRLNRSQREGAFRKKYRALVHGNPGAAGALEDWLVHGEHRAQIVAAGAKDGRKCRLEWRLLERRGAFSLLEIDLQTGRYHQIRAQLGHAGYPIAGDELYGGRRVAQAPVGGIALCSWQIAFPHPVGGAEVLVQSGLEL